jgi:hypothetical protein
MSEYYIVYGYGGTNAHIYNKNGDYLESLQTGRTTKIFTNYDIEKVNDLYSIIIDDVVKYGMPIIECYYTMKNIIITFFINKNGPYIILTIGINDITWVFPCRGQGRILLHDYVSVNHIVQLAVGD